uniref:Peptidase S54 rhomboid domain-containing protein n=1 Tax=Solanum lycopersicum TaxID=4081 RepID=A0A3Q7J7R4_SOLLC
MKKVVVRDETRSIFTFGLSFSSKDLLVLEHGGVCYSRPYSQKIGTSDALGNFPTFLSMIGRYFGPEFLLKLYLSGAVAGSVFYLLYHAFIVPSLQTQRGQLLSMHPSQTLGLGASGAVNAVMLLDIFLFPTKIVYFNLVIPVPAILLGIFMVGKDVLRIYEGDTLVSGSAHLGGAAMAAITWARVRRGRF